jgi:hypothetical protein
MMITIEWGVALSLIGALVGMGIGWGIAAQKLSNVDNRLGNIEKMLSDGNDGVFARKMELVGYKALVDEWRNQVNDRMDTIERRARSRR